MQNLLDHEKLKLLEHQYAETNSSSPTDREAKLKVPDIFQSCLKAEGCCSVV